MNAQDFHAYLVKLAMEAYDATHSVAALDQSYIDRGFGPETAEAYRRRSFAASLTERMATVTVPDRLPSAEEEREMEAHEAEVRASSGPATGTCACGAKDAPVRANPFASEINGDDTEGPLCDECHYQAAMDI